MTSDESETNERSSDSSHELKKKKKLKHKEKKHKKKKNKHSSDLERKKRKKKKRKNSKERKEGIKKPKLDESVKDEDIPGPSVPEDLLIESSKAKAPMTKEEWEKSQSVVRRVYDETGRSRLIKGDGEILEEIVSRERHREINRQATLGDGLFFQNKLMKK